MLHILDEDTLQSEQFSKDFKKDLLTRFISRAVGRHRSEAGASLRELNRNRFQAGDCGSAEKKFCLLLFSAADSAGAAARATFKQLAQRQGRSAVVKAFYVMNTRFMRAFGQAPGAILLYRPKRSRFKI